MNDDYDDIFSFENVKLTLMYLDSSRKNVSSNSTLTIFSSSKLSRVLKPFVSMANVLLLYVLNIPSNSCRGGVMRLRRCGWNTEGGGDPARLVRYGTY